MDRRTFAGSVLGVLGLGNQKKFKERYLLDYSQTAYDEFGMLHRGVVECNRQIDTLWVSSAKLLSDGSLEVESYVKCNKSSKHSHDTVKRTENNQPVIETKILKPHAWAINRLDGKGNTICVITTDTFR